MFSLKTFFFGNLTEGKIDEQVNIAHITFYGNNKADKVYVNGVESGISWVFVDVLTKLNKEGLNTIKFVWKKKLTSINYIFYNCPQIISIDLSKFDSSSLIGASYVFTNSGVENITMPNFDASKITGYKDVFTGCNNLEFIDITNYKGIDIFK